MGSASPLVSLALLDRYGGSRHVWPPAEQGSSLKVEVPLKGDRCQAIQLQIVVGWLAGYALRDGGGKGWDARFSEASVLGNPALHPTSQGVEELRDRVGERIARAELRDSAVGPLELRRGLVCNFQMPRVGVPKGRKVSQSGESLKSMMGIGEGGRVCLGKCCFQVSKRARSGHNVVWSCCAMSCRGDRPARFFGHALRCLSMSVQVR